MSPKQISESCLYGRFYLLCWQIAGNRLAGCLFGRPGWLGHPSRRAFPVVEVKINSESKEGKKVNQMKITFGRSTAVVGILSSMAVLFCLPSMAFAGTILGSAQSFAVLGG